MQRSLLLFLGALTFAGCSLNSPASSVYTILPLPEASPDISAPRHGGTVKLAPTRTLPSLGTKSLRYLRPQGESGEYLYSRWSDAPALLIERTLVSSLQNKTLYAAVLPPGSAAAPSHLLESDLNSFEHRFRPNGGSEGYIDMTYRLVDPKTKQTLASKRFQIVAAAATDDAKGGVDALSRATRELARQSTEWLADYLQEKP